MAFKQKSYRKFVATAATATLVASAVAPFASAASADQFTDVASKYKDAVNFLLEKGATKGMTETQFGVNENIKRVDAAVQLVKVLGLDTENAPASGFTDVPSRAVKEVNALKAAGITSGKTETTFNSDALITRGELAVWIQRAFELKGTADVAFTDVNKNYTDAVSALVTFGITNGINETQFGTDNNAKRGDFAIFLMKAANAEKVAAIEVESVSAVGAKKLNVQFNQAVDTDKAKLTVKKGASNVAVSSVTFSEDKKTATIELNNKLTEGTYTVSVAGLTEKALTAEVKAAKETLKTVKLLSSNAIVVDGGIQFGYQALNQYGEDITSTSLDTVKAVVAGTTPTVNNGIVNIAGTYKADDKVVVTLIDGTTGVSENQTLTVISKAVTSELVINSIYNKDGKALTQDTASEDFYLLVDVKDQYGNAVSSPDIKDFTVVAPGGVSIDGNFTTVTVDKEKKTALKLKVDEKVTAGDHKLIIVANASGASANYTVSLEEGTYIQSVSLGAPTADIVASGDEVTLPIEVKDNKGNVVTDVKELKSNVKVDGLTDATFKLVDGATVVTGTIATADNKEGNAVVSATSSNKLGFDTKVIRVKDKAVATTVVGLKDGVSTSVYAGQSVTLKAADFVVQDQYGRDIKVADENLTVAYTNANETHNVTFADLTLTAGATKGTESLTFGLKDVKDSTTDVTFTVVDRSEFTSYEVADLTKMYAEKIGDTQYDQTVKVYGVTAAGKKVLLPASEYTVYANSDFLKVAGNVLDATDADTTKVNELPADVTVTINATGKEIVKTVAISDVAPTVKKVELIVDGKSVTSKEFAVGEFTVSSLQADVVITDNYGVVTKAENGSVASNKIDRLVITNLTDADKDGSAKVANNGTATATISGLEADDTFDATITVSGVALKVAVTVLSK